MSPVDRALQNAGFRHLRYVDDIRIAVPADQEFDKTLLHYLLTRLGRTKSRIAIPFCLSLLRYRPDETEAALHYFSDVDLTERQVQSGLDYAGSAYAIYDYQLYEILRWFWERNLFPEKLIELCRRWAFDRNRASWLRSYCIAILGKVGDESDLEMIESQYSVALTETQKAECVMALARLERGRRNAFHGRIKHDGELVASAIRHVKERDH
jgi:hypothetical protein